MTSEEMEKTMAFILEQQAQLTATVGRLSETVDTLAGTVGTLAGKVDGLAGKVDRTADSVTALLAIAEIHDREMETLTEATRATDERLSALINTVERIISEGRNGKP
jgi:phage-related tail protein